MTTTKPTPAGWYVDPTGRHEHRYWNGNAWTASVSDAGVSATDEPEVSAAAPVAYGYRAVAVATWRVAALYSAMLVAMAAFVVELIASLNLRAAPSDLSRWAWLYHQGPDAVLYGYPPLGLWFGVILAATLVSALLLPPSQALKKAGLSVRWRWSAPAERARLGAGLSALGHSRTLLRGRGGPLIALLSELTALLVVAVSGYALFAHRGVLNETGSITRNAVGGLAAGLGPKVCLLAGVVSAVLVLVAWPWGRAHHVLVLRDGTVQELQRG